MTECHLFRRGTFARSRRPAEGQPAALFAATVQTEQGPCRLWYRDAAPAN